MENQLKRVRSIDVFRALTMLLMIFVNDLWSLSGIPYWLEHAKADEDFLGLADVVFPCFLFILGMAIPFAIQNRIAKGESDPEIVKHIIIRSVALLIMGIYCKCTGYQCPGYRNQQSMVSDSDGHWFFPDLERISQSQWLKKNVFSWFANCRNHLAGISDCYI
ncbi:heparan-alpha-glucosaminide N-acetyltransferase domain-containing protein [Pseudarcicella hirudinis]|uniref:heparan-alpha-glucosaminide N-acetyltransferase domain-containing protein n=1 Tax=Pseudarcicella hirudinis TaxID=1079859 RepID=UPI0035EAB8BC